MSGTPKETGAELIVTQLNSLDQEEVYRNAEKKTVHSVIKNMPFSIELGLRGQFDPYEVDFHKFTLGCTLVYDTPDERPVDWVKMSPVDCSVQVNETCERAMVEVRLHVLSSQHEDMAFRIKFTAAAPAKSNLASLVVISEPIKVVSKLSQLKKNKKPPSARAKRAAPVAAVPDNELLVSSLARIEAQQRQQQALIDSLVQTVSILQQHRQAPAPSTPAMLSVADVASPSNVFSDDDSYDEPQPRRKRVKLEPAVAEGTSSSSSSQQPSPASQDPSSLFEHHLHGLLATFSQLPAEERATCIHRVFRDQSSNASEVVEALLAESLSSTNQVDPHRPTASFDSNHFYDSNAYQIAPEAFYQHLPVPVLKQEPRTS